ncbi:MAG: hypothetical protein FJW88_09930 [Actinobacteria bacterium]|nr:hypothetical protein [Actinomycetota bacterium]
MIGAGQRATLVVAGLLALVATGCWTQAGQGSGRQGFNGAERSITAANVAGLAVAWSRTGPAVAHEPVVGRGSVYLRNTASVTAVAEADKALRWGPVALGGNAVPTLVADRLLVPTSGGSCSLTALDADRGATLGTRPLGFQDLTGYPSGFSSCTTRDALAAGGRVVVAWHYLGSVQVPHCNGGPLTEQSYNITSGISALDPATLAVIWEHHETVSGCGAPPPVATWPVAFGAPAEVAGGLVTATQSSRVVAFSPACATLCPATWTRDLGVGLVGPPIALGSTLAVVNGRGTVHVLDAATGTPSWTAVVSDAADVSLASDGVSIFAAGADGTLAAFPAGGCGAPACSALWTAQLGSAASARPSIGGDVVYVGTAGGTIAAYPARGCSSSVCARLWCDPLLGDGVTGVAVVDGRVFVAALDGSTRTYAPPSPT